MLSAAFFFSLMAVCVKLLKGRIPAQEIVLARSLFMFVTGAVIIRRMHLPLFGYNRKLLLLRGFFGFLGLSAFFYTLTTIPIADSTIIQYTSPLFTALLAPVILKEVNTGKQWFIYLMAFAGLILVIKPGFSLSLFPALIGLMGAFFSGIAYNLVRKLGQSEHPLHIILYLPAVSIPLSALSTVPVYKTPQGLDWLILLMVGALTFIAQIFLTLGLRADRAARATNISYINVVFTAILGIFIWSEIPDLLTVIGGSIVIVSIILNARSK